MKNDRLTTKRVFLWNMLNDGLADRSDDVDESTGFDDFVASVEVINDGLIRTDNGLLLRKGYLQEQVVDENGELLADFDHKTAERPDYRVSGSD